MCVVFEGVLAQGPLLSVKSFCVCVGIGAGVCEYATDC
jgi:hypothetical protein